MKQSDAAGRERMTDANGTFNYYPPDVTTPILVQIENNWVYSLHFEYTYHVSKFAGRFVRLVEVTEPEPSAAAPQVIDVTLQIVEASTPIEGDAIATDTVPC